VVSTLIALGCCLALAFGAGADGSGGMIIWPLFGTTNQLLAGLTLSIISVILIRQGRPAWFTAVPLAFLLTMSVYALLVQLGQFYRRRELAAFWAWTSSSCWRRCGSRSRRRSR
jgi:carbon starvation protein